MIKQIYIVLKRLLEIDCGYYIFACGLFLITFFLGSYKSFKNRVSWSLLVTYIFMVCSIVIFSRVRRENSQYELSLFWKYIIIFNSPHGSNGLWVEVLLNIVAFIPFGVLAPITIAQNFKQTVVCGLLFSVTIEITQYVFKIGLCELNDIFNNSIGTVLGYLLYWIYNSAKKRQ